MKQKILSLLTCFLMAFGLWVYVVTVISPESEATYHNVPVILINESILTDKGLMVALEENPTVTLQLRGNRTDLNNLKKSDINVVVDLAKVNSAGRQDLSCSISFAGKNSFEVVDQYPAQITVDIAEWETKEVPVMIHYSGALGLDYIALKDEAVLDRDKITVTGPKKVVDQISYARVDVNLDGQVQTFIQSYPYTLCNSRNEALDASGVKTNASEVSLTLRIQRVKELQLQLNVTYGGGANESNTTITMDYTTIKVYGAEKQIEAMPNVLVLGDVDLSQILEDTQLKFPIALPENVKNLSGVEEITVDIAFSDLAVKKVTVTNIVTFGTPMGMTAEIAAKELEITLRGPAALINLITARDLNVRINLSSAGLGEELFKAQVTIANGEFREVGIVGSYTVLVTLRSVSGGEG